MRWLKKASHGDTMDGQMLRSEVARLSKEIRALVADANGGGPASVLPRWRGELRREILVLPREDRVASMSMGEIRELSSRVAGIRGRIRKYDSRRLVEIMG